MRPECGLVLPSCAMTTGGTSANNNNTNCNIMYGAALLGSHSRTFAVAKQGFAL